MIVSFRDADTNLLWDTGKSPYSLEYSADGMEKAGNPPCRRQLANLNVPPGNRLEALSGDRKRQHSIRVNDQYRICFRWEAGNAHDVEIVDYH